MAGDWRNARGALKDEEVWRVFTFTYRLPESRKSEDVESDLADACATVLGCDVDADHEDHVCPAAWVASAGPAPDLDEDGNEVKD